MKKTREKIAFLLLLLVVVFVTVPVSVNAKSYDERAFLQHAVSDWEESNDYAYVIDGYDINIKVNENNTLDITEKLEVYFNEKRHGIYRTIPLYNEITRVDGTTSKNRVTITNINVNGKYTTSKEDNSLKIQIGSEDKYVTGKKMYTIHYTYALGKDTYKDADEFYFNLIGDQWDTIIGNITFTIKMPKKFDESKLGFSYGPKGSTENENVFYYVEGKKIIGDYMGELYPYEALTVRCELPEGYFVNTENPISEFTYLMFLVPGICLVISFILWFIFGKEYPMVETVEFYPPEGFNSLEIGYLYKGTVGNKDITSLLVYLANKGFIKIKEIEGKSLFNSGSDYEFLEMKSYDGNNMNERLFLNGLFRSKRKYSGSVDENSGEEWYLSKVTKQDLYHKFYHTVDDIKKNMNTKDNKKHIFKRTWPISLVVSLLIGLSMAVLLAIPTLEVSDYSMLIPTYIIFAFYTPFYWKLLKGEGSLGSKLLWLAFLLFHSSLLITKLPAITTLMEKPAYLVPFFFGVACVAGMVVCLNVMSKRTKYGAELLGRIKGFKHYLETVEKEKLESMVMENPTYFYEIMSYAYVLGVSDKWIEKFEHITVAAPNWYDSYGTFHVSNFGTFMHHTMKSANSTMSSRPGGSSKGSGGGSSGGGAGGGGGGSW